jgi:hypothetical protein
MPQPPPSNDTVSGGAQNVTAASDLKEQKEAQSTGPVAVAERTSPAPSQAELHEKYDVTKEDVTKAGLAVKQYERYSVVAKADETFADEHPMNQGARARAERSQAFAEKYYTKNVEPFEKTMMGPNGQPKNYLNYEPGADPEEAKKFATRSYVDHKVGPSITPDNDHIQVANGGKFSSSEIPGMRAEMLRDEARDKARDAVAQNPKYHDARTSHSPGL